jgi:hypothetical protein
MALWGEAPLRAWRELIGIAGDTARVRQKAKESELWLDGVEESYGKKYHWPTCPLTPSSKSSIYWIPIP